MYLLDSDTLIRAKNDFYGFDTAPGFWEWLEQQWLLGTLGSVAAIGDELRNGKDELSVWAKNHPRFFQEPDVTVLTALAELATSLTASSYTQAAQAEFLGLGDAWLVAHAKAGGHTVVSFEQSAPAKTAKVKIPDICHRHGVLCTTLFPVARSGGLRLMLERSTT